jgi:SAM-dependent methyltransferase
MNEPSIDLPHFVSDDHFDNLYPKHIQALSRKHWTPVQVAARAAEFLAERPGSRILDIGSGNGKFCLTAAHHQPDSHFYGVEQRKDLIQLANKAKENIAVDNATFIHGNFTRMDLTGFDHFYFYNSFYENLVEDEFHIDENIEYSLSIYEYYTQYLLNVLDRKPVGTKLVTYHSYREIVPPGFYLVKSLYGSLLRCWIKE